MFRERDLALVEWSLGNPVRLHRIVTHHLGSPKPIASAPDEIGLPSPFQLERKVPPVVSPEELMREIPQVALDQNANDDQKIEEKQ